VNEQIRSKEVRVIRGDSSDNSESTVMEIRDALILADDLGLDLVEVAPNQKPPVCRILDYGKFKFIQNKKINKTININISSIAVVPIIKII